MKTWNIHDARARFAGLLEACLAEGPQMITRRGAEVAVVVSAEAWQRLAAQADPCAKPPAATPADPSRISLVVPMRAGARHRVRVRIG